MSFALAVSLSLALVFPFYFPDRRIAGYFLTLVLVLLIFSLRSRKKSLFPIELAKQPVVWFALSYFIFGLYSFSFISGRPGLRATEVEVMIKIAMGHLFYSILPLYVFALGPISLQDARTALLGLVPTGAVISIMYFFAVVTPDGILWAGPSLQGLSKNVTGDVTAATAIAACCLIPTFQSKLAKGCLAMAAIVGLLSCTFAVAKTCVLGIAAAVFLTLLLSSLSTTKKLTAITLVAVFLGGGSFAVWDYLPKKLQVMAQDEAINSKGGIQIRSGEIADASFVLSRMTAPVGWRASPFDGLWNIYNPCNLFLQALIEVGIVGAVLLLGFYISAFLLFLKNFRDLRAGPILAKFVNLAAFCLFLARFMRDMVDYHELALALVLPAYASVGIALFIQFGLERRRKAQFADLNGVEP